MELLDIKLDQVNEWLVVRRKLDKNWSKSIKVIEAKQGLSLGKILNDQKLKTLVDQQLAGYLQSKEILTKLSEQPDIDQSKTVFGNFSNEQLYEWDQLTRSYEKNNLHLADCGKHLLQLGVYDIPSYKSTESSLEKQLKELQHKETALQEEINKKQKFLKEKCKNYGIAGDNIPYELKLKTRKIPEIYLNIIEQLNSDDFNSLLATYIKVTKENHNSQVNLPTLEKLKKFNTNVDLPTIQNKYCNLIQSVDTSNLDLEAEDDWEIVAVEDQEGVMTGEKLDLPLESKEVRTDLVTELIELQAFAENYEGQCDSLKKILKQLVDSRELVLMYDQPSYIDRLVQDFARSSNHNLPSKLNECQKLQQSIRADLKENREKISELLKFASKLIVFLETHINKLFPTISVKIVGEIVKDIRSQMSR